MRLGDTAAGLAATETGVEVSGGEEIGADFAGSGVGEEQATIPQR